MEEFDNNYKKDLDNMKRQIQEEKLSDNFKENLYKKMEQAEKAVPKNNRIHFSKGLVAVLACFVFVLISASLAREIDNIVLNHFSNIDKIAKKAVDEGKVKYLNQDYVTDQGISIKAEYIFEENNNLYVVLDAKSENGNKIYLENFELINDDGIVLYKNNISNGVITTNIFYSFENGTIVYIKIMNLKENEMVKYLQINKVFLESDEGEKNVDGDWKITLD